MILISALTSVFFFGGWLSPFDGYLSADAAIRDVRSWRLLGNGFHWLFLKIGILPVLSSCGSARRSRATATTRSCGSAGRC